MGDDWLTGGADDDLFIFRNGDGDDTITDFSAGEGVGDRIDLTEFGFALFIDVLNASTDVGGNVVIQMDDDSITLEGVNLAQLHADDFVLNDWPPA